MARRRMVRIGLATAIVLLALAAGVEAFHDDPFVNREDDGTVEAESFYEHEPACEFGETVERVDSSEASGGTYVRIPAETCSLYYGVADEAFVPGDIRVKGVHGFSYCVEVRLNLGSADAKGLFWVHPKKAAWSTCFSDGTKTWKTLSPDVQFTVGQGQPLDLVYVITDTDGPNWSRTNANLQVDWWNTTDA